ncbi:hypothetical protein DFR86_09330 [Acidianus sulfidivorans JP7]|uniref:hypothetical protein n=1 Tax=Acidianus sulfidivorans TaxID=312539 RepID=UPI0013A587EC|nr:hypothetical protein [Acidianus sulfidivorans]AWR97728.2 hypothetical protein DFR86_09330 [Acidianus sulfidivorans JP7]
MFDIFKREKTKESYTVDELGEWIIISNNSRLSLLYRLIERSVKKLGIKSFNLYIIHFSEDHEIRNLFSVKGFIRTKNILRESDFIHKLSEILSEYGILGEIDSSKLRFCNVNYIFFRFDILIKKNKKAKANVKVLLPPLGVKSIRIPYTSKELFKDIFENDSSSICSPNLDLKDDKNAKIVALCSDNIDLENLKYALSYFTKDFNISFKYSGVRNLEIQVNIKDFNKYALIPLLWDNFIDAYVSSC